MKRNVTAVILCLSIFLATPCLNSSARAQSPETGYWEFKNAEYIVFDKDGKVVIAAEPFDVKGGAFTEQHHGARSITVVFENPKVPETISGDTVIFEVSGTAYGVLRSSKWPNLFKIRIEDDVQTASGEIKKGFGHVPRVVSEGKKEEFDVGTSGSRLMPGEDITGRLRFIIDDSYGPDAWVDTWTILFHYKWRTGKQTADKQPTDSLSGRWSGTWTNNKGESGTSKINIREDAGIITGDEDGWVIENGRLSGNVLTWMYRNQSNGCRDYKVRWEIAADGGTANGTYTVTDRCEGKTYTGKYINYHR